MSIDENKKRVVLLTYVDLAYLHDLLELLTSRIGQPVTLSEHWIESLQSSKSKIKAAVDKIEKEET